VILAIEGQFQGGGIGEVSGAKIAAALDLALEDARRGQPFKSFYFWKAAVFVFRKQILVWKPLPKSTHRSSPAATPTGRGGHRRNGRLLWRMSITASLCTYLIRTRQARLAPNGPEVIEEQSGIEEFDSKDRQLIWGVTGGEQRYVIDISHQLESSEMRKLWSKGKQL